MSEQLAFFAGMAIAFGLAAIRPISIIVRALPTITLSLIAAMFFTDFRIPTTLLAAMVGGSLLTATIHLFAIQAMRAMDGSDKPRKGGN
jgi:hypothetical protein